MKDDKLNKVDEALLNRAIGFSKDDITEEFSIVEDELVLVKKKKNTKYYPPELKAIEMLKEEYGAVNEYSDMSLDELNKEREKLLEMLKEAEDNARKKQKKK